MREHRWARNTARGLAAGAGLAAAGYGIAVAWNWIRYGHVSPATESAWVDEWLDGVLPDYDVVERHCIDVTAPAAVTLETAKNLSLRDSAIARAIFMTRERILGAGPTGPPSRIGLLDETIHLGWRVLSDVPGRQVVLGAVTKPWEANVVFRGLSREEFRTFVDPGYVKIVWTLRVDPRPDGTSTFRTETRARATSPDARRRFRWYWARFAPGIALIRQVLLAPLKAKAEESFGAMQTLGRGEA